MSEEVSPDEWRAEIRAETHITNKKGGPGGFRVSQGYPSNRHHSRCALSFVPLLWPWHPCHRNDNGSTPIHPRVSMTWPSVWYTEQSTLRAVIWFDRPAYQRDATICGDLTEHDPPLNCEFSLRADSWETACSSVQHLSDNRWRQRVGMGRCRDHLRKKKVP